MGQVVHHPVGRASSSRIDVDASRWPLVIVTWPAGPRTDADVDAALEALDAIGARPEPHALLLDARDATSPTPRQLASIVAVAQRRGAHTACLARAILTRSSVVRSFVDSLRWLHLGPAAWGYFDERAPALSWLDGHLASAGLAAPHPPGGEPPSP